jgi:hypothetical protein
MALLMHISLSFGHGGFDEKLVSIPLHSVVSDYMICGYVV